MSWLMLFQDRVRTPHSFCWKFHPQYFTWFKNSKKILTPQKARNWSSRAQSANRNQVSFQKPQVIVFPPPDFCASIKWISPTHHDWVSCFPLRWPFQFQTDPQAHSRFRLLAEMDPRRPSFHPTMLHKSKNQIYANKNSRFTSIITNSKTSMGRYINGFYYSPSIWVISDTLTQYAHFIALPTHFTAQQLTKRFSLEICRLHDYKKPLF